MAQIRYDCKREIGSSGVWRHSVMVNYKVNSYDRMTSHPRASYLPFTELYLHIAWGCWLFKLVWRFLLLRIFWVFWLLWFLLLIYLDAACTGAPTSSANPGDPLWPLYALPMGILTQCIFVKALDVLFTKQLKQVNVWSTKPSTGPYLALPRPVTLQRLILPYSLGEKTLFSVKCFKDN